MPENDLLGDGRAEKIFQSMLDQEMASNFAQGQSIGLAKMIYEQMSAMFLMTIEIPNSTRSSLVELIFVQENTALSRIGKDDEGVCVLPRQILLSLF